MSKTVKEQWIELAKIRAWITDQLPAETGREVRDNFFEARQAIGSAMLHLERVEYRTGGNYSDSEKQVE
jgi:hypothetical protein